MLQREDQLLLYMRKKEKVGKSYIIYMLEISFTLLNKKNELIILASTECLAEGIRKSIVHTA